IIYMAMTKSARTNPTDTLSTRRRLKPASPPAWIKPQLAELVEKAPDGPDWLHEIKFDGYRMHARLVSSRAQILTRRGNDWTEKYPTGMSPTGARGSRSNASTGRNLSSSDGVIPR